MAFYENLSNTLSEEFEQNSKLLEYYSQINNLVDYDDSVLPFKRKDLLLLFDKFAEEVASLSYKKGRKDERYYLLGPSSNKVKSTY